MTGAVTGTPVWVAVEPEPLYAVLHLPDGAPRTGLGVLILPPFGWDGDCSYRARRVWATQLAESGVAAARIDLPGTENSVGSPLAPHRFDTWIAATSAAASWLRAAAGCERVAAIGIGIGGLIAYHSAAQGGPIDDLILWATRATGRAHLRELRAYATVASGEIGDEPEPARSDGATSIAGHLMSQETVADLTATRIVELPLPQASRRRVLLIGRDAHGVDPKLEEHLANSGVELTLLPADDYHRLVALPELRQAPTKTIAASIDWLRDGAVEDLEPITWADPRPAPGTTDQIEFAHDDATIRERICEFDTSEGRLVGILSQPVVPGRATTERAPYCLLALNSGELRHTGPNRLLVEVAREAAARGVPALRFDLPGLGDSDGDSVRTFERAFEHDAGTLAMIDQIYDQLERLQISSCFIPTGLCLGGYFALRSVLESERSGGAIAINPPAFRWTSLQRDTLRKGLAAVAPELVAAESSRGRLPPPVELAAGRLGHVYRLLELSARRRLARSNILWRVVRRAGVRDAWHTLERLGRKSAPILLLLAEDESVLRALEQPKLADKLARSPNLVVERLPTHDHNLRPLAGQEAALKSISRALRAGMWSADPSSPTSAERAA